jgi:hypothetical protein
LRLAVGMLQQGADLALAARTAAHWLVGRAIRPGNFAVV